MVAGMVRTVVVRKRSIIIYGIIIIVLAFITVILTTYLQGNKDNGYITYARAAKMVAYAQVDDCDAFISDGDWYKPYIDYVNVNGYMYAANPNGYVKYKDIGLLAQSLKAAGNCFEDIGITSYEDIINDNRLIKEETFIKCFERLLKYFKYGSEIELKQLG